MKLLLDTHIWVWSALDRARLSRRVVNALEDPENELLLSPISLLEVLTLCFKQRLNLYPNPQAWITNTLDAFAIREAPVGFEIAQETARVQLPHRDPTDRFLIATARILGLTLVTADETILKSRTIAVLANR